MQKIDINGLNTLSDITNSDLKNKITKVRIKNKNFMGLVAGMMAGLVVVAGVVAVNMPSKEKIDSVKEKTSVVLKSQEKTNESILDNVKSKITDLTSSEVQQFIPNETDLTKKHNAYEDVKKAGNFSIEKNLSDSQIAKHLSVVSLDKSNYFLALASIAEGYRKNPYADNKGIATGLGYNASMQTKYTNTQIFSMVTNDSKIVQSGVNLTGVMSMDQANPQDIKNVTLAPQQAAMITQMMRYQFASEMPQIIGDNAKLNNSQARKEMKDKGLSTKAYGELLLNELKPNEKEALVYHTYKVGAGGFSKYKGLITSLVNYRYSNTKENADIVASHFNYKYTINGVVKEDTRATGLVSNMFLDPNSFGYFVGKIKTYPDSLKSRIAKIHPNTFKSTNTASNSGENAVELADEVGEYIEDLNSKGIRIENIKIEQRLNSKDLEPYSAKINSKPVRPMGSGAFFGGTF